MQQLLTIEHFQFEQDFMEDGIRCIPMIVRFKLDACGIKLKLKEWSKMNMEERANLAEYAIDTVDELILYKKYVQQLILIHTGNAPTELIVNKSPLWAMMDEIPEAIQEKMNELNQAISLGQWQQLNTLQRFALMKLTRPGHENKNFPKAVKEFGLI